MDLPVCSMSPSDSNARTLSWLLDVSSPMFRSGFADLAGDGAPKECRRPRSLLAGTMQRSTRVDTEWGKRVNGGDYGPLEKVTILNPETTDPSVHRGERPQARCPR